MASKSNEEVLPAPPQPPLLQEEEPFTNPPIVVGIEEDDKSQTNYTDSISNVFSSLTTHVSEAMRVSRSAVSSVLPNSKATLPAVLFFGDSLTEYSSHLTSADAPGWSQRLHEVYDGKVDLYIRGFSGYNTRYACHLLPRILSQCGGIGSVRVVVIFFGANDAVITSEAQHVPLREYADNLRKLANYVKSYRKLDPILPVLVTPPPVQEEGQGDPVPSRLAARTKEYASACVAVARKLACPVIDLHSEMISRLEEEFDTEDAVQKGLERYLIDGLHFTSTGNEVVAEMMLEMFRKEVPALSPDMVKRPFPPWREIDNSKPEASLGSNHLA